MLKMDFPRAVLNRIPNIAAAPDKAWRPIVFICDEYHLVPALIQTYSLRVLAIPGMSGCVTSDS